jgi:crotonobetainyl-CoA:carnitine CoA-transferase CaiB-like acyl-CoA transferase
VQARDWMLPALREIVRKHSAQELQDVFQREGLPYAPIVRPEQLFDDPHLLASGGLAELTLADGETTPVPLLPLLLGGRHLKPRMALPKIGAQDAEFPGKAKARKRRRQAQPPTARPRAARTAAARLSAAASKRR